MFDKIVVITKKTALEELVERFNSREQARFYIEHSGLSFAEYEAAHSAYARSLEALKKALPSGVKHQFIERAFIPNFIFGPKDLVVTLGPDGLVVNAAKYLDEQYIIAVNPDPGRIDGILLPFSVGAFANARDALVSGEFFFRPVTMAKASMNDGQSIHGFNDIFIGPKSHISLRCNLRFAGASEDQCSSGIIISTGAGSTGWLKAVIRGARGTVESLGGGGTAASKKGGSKATSTAVTDARQAERDEGAFAWDSDHLFFAVREPFESRTSKTGIVFGKITAKTPLVISSQMPSAGVIFSDGIESDSLEFNSGRIATVAVASKKAMLVTKPK